MKEPSIDAVAIATPISTHFKIARDALLQGKHVLIEKTLVSSSSEAERLIDIADKAGLIIMVDHTFIYTGAVRKMKEIIENNQLGDLYYFDSVRVNLGLFRHDVNVLWDLAPHDISIMHYIMGKKALAVSAIGACHAGTRLENIAYITVFFDNPLIAHIHVNWLAPVKIRKTLVCGSKQMIVYDDTEPSEKVKVYDAGVIIDAAPEEIYQTLVTYRTGDMYAPRLDPNEALNVECKHFIDCIQSKRKPITDGEAGLQVLRVLEAAQKSINSSGKKIKLA